MVFYHLQWSYSCKNIKKSWANIDVLLMQRSDEIPKLIKVLNLLPNAKKMFDNVMVARKHI